MVNAGVIGSPPEDEEEEDEEEEEEEDEEEDVDEKASKKLDSLREKFEWTTNGTPASLVADAAPGAAAAVAVVAAFE